METGQAPSVIIYVSCVQTGQTSRVKIYVSCVKTGQASSVKIYVFCVETGQVSNVRIYVFCVKTGHSSPLKSPLVFWPGASWLGKRCTTNSTCISSNSQCFKGKCLCSPGYYYSEEDRRCIGGKCTAQTQHAAHLLVVSLHLALAPCYSEYREEVGSKNAK